jgi:hypothetical protein
MALKSPALDAAPGTEAAGSGSIVHVLITADDLAARRVETVIRDFAGATHLLDIYTGKRVDKRKVGGEGEEGRG